MAYSGGVYTKPIESGLSGLANLYLQGKMQVINMRAKVREQRSEELAAYAKAASEIEATSVAEIDKLYQQGANLLRDGAVKAHNSNILGLTSRSYATAQVNNFTTQASQIANSSKIVSSNVEAMREELGKRLDPISEARYLRTWFTQKGKNQSVLKIDDNQGGYLNIPGYEAISAELDEDTNKINYRKSFNYVDPNTGRIEVGTNMAGVTDLADPSPYLIERFDANDNVKEFISTIGNSREVSMVRGEPAGDIQYSGSFRLGESDVYTRIIAPEALSDVSNRIEMELNSLASDDDTVISFLSQEFGARAPGDKGFTKMKSEQEINELFGATTVLGEDGKPTGQTIPKIYDEFGQQVQFTNTYQVEDPPGSGQMKEFIMDPTTFQLNEFGIEQISDDQRNLFKAIMRDKYLKAMNVKVDDYRERDRLKRTSAKTPKNILGGAFTYQKTVNGVTDFSQGDYDYFASIGYRNHLTEQGFGATDANGKSRAEIVRQIESQGYYPGAKPVNTTEQTFIKPSSDYFPVQISSEISKVVEDADFKISSTTNKNIESPTSFVGVEEEDGKIKFFFVGKAVVAKSVSDYELKTGTKGTTSSGVGIEFNEQGEVVETQMALFDEGDHMKLYTQMYDNSEEFRTIMQSLQFDEKANNPNISGKNNYTKALLAYTKNITQ